MNTFLYACGTSVPLQLAVHGSSTSENGVRLLHQPFALIGRDQRADVPLDHKLVSRRHVYLQVVEGEAFWVDLDSRSGTLVDGQLRKFGWLEAGKVLRIGPFELQRLVEGSSLPEGRAFESKPAISPLVARSHTTQPLPDVALEFLNGPSRSACWPMNRVMSIIGAAAGCKFRLADPSVSLFHCVLLRTPLGLWVIDLLGTDGIVVNDALVRYALLADNDILKVGRYRIRIRSQFAGREQAPRSDIDKGTQLAVPGAPRGNFPGIGSPGAEPPISGFPALNPANWSEPFSKSLTILESAARAQNANGILPTASEPIQLEKAELTESVLVPLVNQFGLMQQQMLDQFQQTISMLVQMFGSLHRDQMDRIREELDQLRDLTKEFHALKLELAARSQSQVSSPAIPQAPSPAIDPAESPQVHAGQEGIPKIKDVAEPMVRPVSTRPSPTPTPAAPIVFPSNSLESLSPSSQDPLDASGLEHSGASKAQSRADGSSPGSDRDVIVWLHQRMTTLQQERETRWQRIMKLLPGLS